MPADLLTSLFDFFISINLALIGILITVATVVYSFCLAKRERLVHLSEKRKQNKDGDLVLDRTIIISQKNLDSLRTLLKTCTILLSVAILLFLIESIITLFNLSVTCWISIVILSFSALFILIILIFFVALFISGFKTIETRIKK